MSRRSTSTATGSRAPLVEPVAIGPTWQKTPDGRWLLPPITLGWQALAWTATYLRHPDGPDAGKPWRYTDEQARFLLWWYAIDEHGKFVYRRGMLRRLKGWGKDPVGATFCAIELCGPCRFGGWGHGGEPLAVPHSSPWVITAAVSLDQTKNTMRLFPFLFSEDAIAEHRIDIGKEIIYTSSGLLEAVTSSPRALEGKRTTFSLKNETHHWLENNDGLAMAEVISRNNTKARGGDARALAISNAHNPGEGSDAELDFEAYESSLTGRGGGDFLYDSLESPEIDMRDPEQVRAGLVAARGDSTWLDLDRHVAEILDPRTREGMSRRFYLNQIVAGDDTWLKRSDWDSLAKPRPTPGWMPICVGFDGADSDDWTVIRCETQDGYQFTPTFRASGKPMIWDPAQYGGYTPRHEVNAAVAELFDQYQIVRFYADPPYWQSEIDEWASRYGDTVVLRWATWRPRQMAEALERLRTDVMASVEAHRKGALMALTHDGCPVTSRHIGNAHMDHRPQGVLIRKDRPISRNKIDAAMSSALAREAAFDCTADGLWPSPNYAYGA